MSCEPQLTKRLGVHQRVTYYLGKLLMKTFLQLNQKPVKRDWYVVDATGKTLGRLATELARRLRGKHKAEYTPHVDTGDYIIVLNAEKKLLLPATSAKTKCTTTTPATSVVSKKRPLKR